MQYRKITIPELGELDFCGNTGAFGEFESESGLSIQDIATQKTISIANMYLLLFWCHYVASKKLKKDIKATREDFKIYLSGKDLVKLTTELIQDIVSDLGFGNDSENTDADTEKKR